MTTPRLILIDGHAVAFRAFHALAESGLRAADGEPTYAVFGFGQILFTALQDHRPSHIIVAFDLGRTFRHDLYTDYKAHRGPAPDEFHTQLGRIQELIQKLHIPIYTAPGYEADDVIGTLARQAGEQSMPTTILTGDTDTLQLVRGDTTVLLSNPLRRAAAMTLYDEPRVRERYGGLAPDQLADLRGLKGDTSDNIPGVKGIGEAGAIQLLNTFHDVENLYAHLDEVPPRYRKHLEGQREQAFLSRHLAVIDCHVPNIELDLAKARWGGFNRQEVIDLLRDMDCESLVRRLYAIMDLTGIGVDGASSVPASTGVAQLDMFGTPVAPAAPAPVHGTYQAVTTPDELAALVSALKAAPAFAFDTEGNGLDPLQAELVGISIATQPGAAWYIPVGHREGVQLPRKTVLDAVRPFFEDAKLPKYAHNAKFDIEMLGEAGVPVNGLTFDTMVAAGLLGKRMGLKELSFTELRLAEPMIEISSLIGRGTKQIVFGDVPVEQATPYAAADADMTLRLVEPLREQLAQNSKMQSVFDTIEMPLVEILTKMECAGIAFDPDYLENLRKDLEHRLGLAEDRIYQLAGERFNINSAQQLNNVLFTTLQLPTTGLSKTASGQYSLTADVLDKLQDQHEIVAYILNYRQLAKLKSTYVDALPALRNPKTGRVHTSYNQMGAATGRLSSTDPNLQNIPVRTEEGMAIRRAFIAAPGQRFLAADYSQIELRVLAHMTEDPQLIEAFKEGQDIHAATASQLFNIPAEQVDKNQRRLAKTVVFGVIYGISGFGLAARTNLSRGEAQELINVFFQRFPRIRSYMDDTLRRGRDLGYVETMFGRRRLMPDLNTSNGARRQAAEREAINAPIQGTAADLMKMAMIAVDNALNASKLQARMLLQVHDELIFEAPEAEIIDLQRLVINAMENVYELRVPLGVETESGENWKEMKELARPS